MANAEIVTRIHMMRVSDLLGSAAIELIHRAARHDQSKLTPQELVPLQALQDHTDKHGQAPYGTPEYERNRQMLAPMLEQHYANNGHHPEHYINGIAGMDLFDVIEMFFDWKAASERGGESAMNLSHSSKAYDIPPMLDAILRNTAGRLGYSVK